MSDEIETIDRNPKSWAAWKREAERLQKIIDGMALAAMDSEPVAWTWHYREQWHVTNDERRAEFVATDGDVAVLPLYRHAQPAKSLELAGWQFKSVNGDWLGLIDEHGKNQAIREGCEVREVFAIADGVNDRDNVRRKHAEWSQATFGSVGPVGPLKHLSKEALEAAAEPGDLSEWADMQFLLWDAQRRAGITDKQITQAMIEKLAVNKLREWPEPKDGEPRLHIKEQPAPAFPDFDNVLESLDYEVRCNAWESEHVLKACQATYDACRAAMLQELQKSAGAEATCRSNKNVQVLHTKSPAQSDCCPAQNHVSPEQNGDTPAQSQGWIPVSDRMPGNGIQVLVSDVSGHVFVCHHDGSFWVDFRVGIGKRCITHWMPLPAPPKEVK